MAIEHTGYTYIHTKVYMCVFRIGVTDPKLCFDSEKVLSLAKTIRDRYENVSKLDSQPAARWENKLCIVPKKQHKNERELLILDLDESAKMFGKRRTTKMERIA